MVVAIKIDGLLYGLRGQTSWDEVAEDYVETGDEPLQFEWASDEKEFVCSAKNEVWSLLMDAVLQKRAEIVKNMLIDEIDNHDKPSRPDTVKKKL